MDFKLRNIPDFGQYLFRITTATSLDDLSAVIAEMRTAYGLAHIVYHAVHIPGGAPANPILIPTYSQEWVQRYKAKNYFRIDPVVLAARKNSLPVDWSDVDHESKEARDFFTEADRFEVGRHGVTLPIRAAAGERALLTITSNKTAKEWHRQRGAYIREFQTFASYLHDRAGALSGYRPMDDSATLSPRELQCLELTARGFAPKRTAEHLDISDDAVRMYLRSACCKLKCMTVHQAIAKLIHREVIDPQIIYN